MQLSSNTTNQASSSVRTLLYVNFKYYKRKTHLSGCVAQFGYVTYYVATWKENVSFFYENLNYVTLTNTLQTTVVVGALLPASQREPAACPADNFVISFVRQRTP